MTDFKSDFLQNYTIIPSEFDKGGFGCVYKVSFKTSLDEKIYIVKLVEPDEDKSSLERAQKEVEVTKKLQHENIITIFESWVEFPPVLFQYPYSPMIFNPDGVLFIRMEHGDLRSLKKWLEPPKKTLEEGWILFYQICQGLAYLHSQSVVHRDLKPANIVLKTNETDGSVVAKIVDFGLATELRSRMTSRLGTPYYISPEVAKSGGKYTEKADVYSFGIMLSQMIVYTKSTQSPQECEDYFLKFRKEDAVLGIPKPFKAEKYFSAYDASCFTSKEKELASRMTAEVPADRISSDQVIKAIAELYPESQSQKILAYKYTTNPSEYTLNGTAKSLRCFKLIPHEQANILTKLTLSFVRITDIADLPQVLKHCNVLTHLHLTIELSTVQLYYGPVHLPHLKSFYLHQLNEDVNYKFEEYMNENKLKNMMFFGPLEQIWENQMNVTVIYGEQLLVDINLDQGTFLLFGACSLRLLPILKHLHLPQISLHHMIDYSNDNSHHYTPPILWEENHPSNCQKLTLFNVPLDVRQGNLFMQKNFDFLTELQYEARIHTFTREIFDLQYISQTIRRLHLGNVTLRLDKHKKLTLEYLCISSCKIPKEFITDYKNLFEVEEITIITVNVPAEVNPNVDLVDQIFSTQWKTMRFATFDWTITDQNRDFADYLVGELNKKDLPLHCHTFQMQMIDGKFTAKQINFDDLNRDKRSITKRPGLEKPLSSKTTLALYVGLPDGTVDNSLKQSNSFVFDGFQNNGEYEKIRGFSPNSLPLKNIHIKNATIHSNDFSVLLKRYNKSIVSIILENVKFEENFRLKVDFPELKTFKVLLNEGTTGFKNTQVDQFFTGPKLLSLLLFSPNGKGFKGLWQLKINTYISSSRHKVLELTSDEITIQFLNFAEDLLKEVEIDHRLKSLVLHRVKCPISSLPCHFTTRLNLTQVTGIRFQEIFNPLDKFPKLKELFFDAIEVDIKQEVDLGIIKNHPSLETLMIGGVTIIKLAEITLNTLTIQSCILPLGFEVLYLHLFNVKQFVLLGTQYYIPFFKTLWPLFKTENVLTSVIFTSYARRSDVIEKCLKDRFNEINGMTNFENVQQEKEIHEILLKLGLDKERIDFKLFRETTKSAWKVESIISTTYTVNEFTNRNKLSDYVRIVETEAIKRLKWRENSK